jgi:TPR repeat protein
MAIGWLGRAAAQGNAYAALNYNRLRNAGVPSTSDEHAIVAAMRDPDNARDGRALAALTYMVLYGRGVEPDPVEALRLLRAAADAGDSYIQLWLADLLLSGGPGLAPDPRAGAALLQRSAESGNAFAMERLGTLRFSGPAALRDAAEAYRWLMRGAMAGFGPAQQRLIDVLMQGITVDGRALLAPDPVQAEVWTVILERIEGHAPGREALERSLTPAQIAEARRRAADWHAVTPEAAARVAVTLPAGAR